MTPKEIADYIKSQIVTGVQRFSVGSRGTSVPANIHITNVIQGGGGGDDSELFKSMHLNDLLLQGATIEGIIVNRDATEENMMIAWGHTYNTEYPHYYRYANFSKKGADDKWVTQSVFSIDAGGSQFVVNPDADKYSVLLLHVEKSDNSAYILYRKPTVDEVYRKTIGGTSSTLVASFDPMTCKSNFLMANPYSREGLTVCFGLVDGNKMRILARWNDGTDYVFDTMEFQDIQDYYCVDRGLCCILGKKWNETTQDFSPGVAAWMPYAVPAVPMGGIIQLGIGNDQYAWMYPVPGGVYETDDGTGNYIVDMSLGIRFFNDYGRKDFNTISVSILMKPDGTRTIVQKGYNTNPFERVEPSYDYYQYTQSFFDKFANGALAGFYLTPFAGNPDVAYPARIVGQNNFRYLNGTLNYDRNLIYPQGGFGLDSGSVPLKQPKGIGPYVFWRDASGRDHFTFTTFNMSGSYASAASTLWRPLSNDAWSLGEWKCARKIGNRVFLVGTRFNDVLYKDNDV